MFHLAVIHSTQGEDFSHCLTQEMTLATVAHSMQVRTLPNVAHSTQGEDFCPLLYTACRRRLLPLLHTACRRRLRPMSHTAQGALGGHWSDTAHHTGCSGRSLIRHRTPQKPVMLAETFLWSLTSRQPLLMTQAMLLSKHRKSTAEQQPVWPTFILPLCVRSRQHDPPSSILCVTGAASLNHPLPSFVWQEQPAWPALFHPILCVMEGANLPTLPHKETQAILPNQMWCTKSLSKYTQTVHFPHNSCYFQQFSFAWRKEKPLWSPNTGVLQRTVEPTNNK